METVLALLSQEWFKIFIGTLFGAVISFLITYFFYRKSQIRPSLSYQMQSFKIIEKSKQILPKEVKIFFGDNAVPRLTKTEVVLWNSGRTTFRENDIVVGDPLRLEFHKNTQILQARVTKSNRDANQFTSVIRANSPNVVDFNFNYLDPGDGVVIEILHTDKELYHKIEGTMRGLPKGAQDWGYIYLSPFYNTKAKYKSLQSFIRLVTILFSIISIFLGSILAGLTKGSILIKPPAGKIPLLIFGVCFLILGPLYIIVLLINIWFSRKRFPKSLMTKDIW